MSMSRNIFSSDMPMASYRDELFKGDETKMADPKTHRSRCCKLGVSSSPQSARAYQFSGEGSGDCRKFAETSKNSSNCGRNTFEWKDNPLNAPATNRWDNHVDRRSTIKRSTAGTLHFSHETADDEVENPLRSSMINSGMASKNTNDLRDPINSDTDRTKEWSKDCLEDAAFPSADESAPKLREGDFEMDLITLLGLVLGLLLSKVIRFISNYANWILNQAIFLRNAIFGRNVLVDLLNLEDSSRLSIRNKIFLLPVVALYGVFYGSIVIMTGFLQLLLKRAPQKLIAILKKWHSY